MIEAPRPRLAGAANGPGGAAGPQQGQADDGDDDDALDEQEWRVASTLTMPRTSGVR